MMSLRLNSCKHSSSKVKQLFSGFLRQLPSVRRQYGCTQSTKKSKGSGGTPRRKSTPSPRAGIDCNAYKAIIKEIMHKCDNDPCKDAEFPRFDELYYKPTDKETRVYQQTWCEMPPLKMKEEKLCLEPVRFVSIEPERRKRIRAKMAAVTDACDVAKEKSKRKMDLLNCRELKSSTPPGAGKNCPRFILPFCKPVRSPPSCSKDLGSKQKKCKKEEAPYPSFSECLIDPVDPDVITECKKELSMCEVWRAFVRKHTKPTGPVKCQTPSKSEDTSSS